MDQVGQLEQYVMLAILRRRPKAYAFAIKEELKARIGREYTVGAIFAALDKLERKGFVKAKKGEATPVRGGRAKRYFNLTAAGRAALTNFLKGIDNLRASTRSVPVAP
jgi:PadR family transcriptional regulator, regulatory protein PadR